MPAISSNSLHIGVLLYTYDRTDDARINMEIIRKVWPSAPLLKDVVIIHAFNGEEEWWPEPYLEDKLCRTENPGHFGGAELLLNVGMRAFIEEYPEITHVVVLASDTWCVKPDYIERVIREMADEQKYLATCAWGSKHDSNMFTIGMALDFCIVNANFIRESGFFPLRYQNFAAKYGELLMYQGTLPYLERVLALRFKQAIASTLSIPSENLVWAVTVAHLYHMREREPVHYDKYKFPNKRVGKRYMYWSAMGLMTHHDPIEKRRIFKKYNLPLGEYGRKFIESPALSYFNQGKKRTEYKKGDTKIDYND